MHILNLIKNNPVFIIVKKEVKDLLRDYRLSVPIIFFVIVLPTLCMLGVKFIIFTYGEEKMAPMSISLSLIFPISVLIVTFFPSALTVVIALESFVGEKERLTLENLLLIPAKDSQIYFGKLIASFITPIFLGYLSFVLYFVQCKVYLKYFTRWDISLVILLLVFVKSLLLVSGAVVLSIYAKTVRAANLNATLIVFPVTFLIGFESHLLMHSKTQFLWLILFELIIYCLIFLKIGIKLFHRENLLLSDTNIFSASDFFKDVKTKFLLAFIGKKPTIEYFLKDTFSLIAKNRRKILLMCITLLLGFFTSYYYVWYLLPENKPHHCEEIIKMTDYDISHSFTPGVISKHNIRAIIIVTILSVFTFGASALIFVFVPGAIIGGLTALNTDGSLYCILHYLKFLLPHGIVEIPAAIVVATFIFNLGTFIFRVDSENKPFDVFIKCLGNLARILVITIPLFIFASFLEVYW